MRLLLFVIPMLASMTARADDCVTIDVWQAGKPTATVCRSVVVDRGMVVVELGDDWVPPVLEAEGGDAAPPYRATYLALAQERFADAGNDGVLAKRDRYLELYGIAPSFAVVRSRLADDARHACHDAIDDSPFARAPDRIAEETAENGRARIVKARALRSALEHARGARKLADLDALAAVNAYYQRAVDRLAGLEAHVATIRTLQAHLACDGLFEASPLAGAYTWQTSNAIAVFQRGVMLLPTGVFDAQTRALLAVGSRERDFRTALRVLRERVSVAAGLIEDGTAGGGEGTVLGRVLVPAPTTRVRGHEPLEGAAPDLRSLATEAAARALGWEDAATAGAFLGASRSNAVAIALPTRPAYHRPQMELEVELDRGDVWHDATPRRRDIARRPALILYTLVEGRRIPLVRWPTTIGGWQKQQTDGDVATRWKESPTGPRIWRDLYVGPSWLPPASTPDRELVRRTNGGYALAREQLGPSYRAAFGMIAFIHLVEEQHLDNVAYRDQGIRTHGTGNLVSLAAGVSHGCHRLLGHDVVRLANFVLAHRTHVPRGNTPTYYRRIVRAGGRFPIAIDSLGYRIELVPPIHVTVLPGRVHRRAAQTE